jgi:imidazolonepropionase-like amidohydrolase
MVDAGMTPAEAITAATITASHLLGLENEIGTLQAGNTADMIAVSGDPMKDVTELERVRFVMRSGIVAKK